MKAILLTLVSIAAVTYIPVVVAGNINNQDNDVTVSEYELIRDPVSFFGGHSGWKNAFYKNGTEWIPVNSLSDLNQSGDGGGNTALYVRNKINIESQATTVESQRGTK